jgi:alkanesulfonate monooxygenase SsuD/methylene tetrahydromethanopterin reductase-like flavin-dependent oxidoreductase (luciferase family)
MRVGFSIDPDQGLSPADELRLVRLAAELGYGSAWTPSGADAAAFDRCVRWHEASGLPTGIAVVPASGNSPEFYAEQATRVWKATEKSFTLGVGSGQMRNAAESMRRYIGEVRRRLPGGAPLHLAALGPMMLRVAGELADGVALNWCSAAQVAWSRQRVEDAARSANRQAPQIVEYIRTAVDDDEQLAQRTVATAAARYLAIPAYRRHYERMGVAEELERTLHAGAMASSAFISKIGAAGKPAETRHEFERLATGLDLAIVRVLVTRKGDAESARRVLEECRPS